MTDEQIQEYLNNLVKRSLAKGLGTPAFNLTMSADSSISGYLSYRISEAGEYKTEWLSGDSALDVLQQMSAHINQLRSKEEREHEAYLRKISDAVEYGRKIGIDQALVNPLIEQMKKLSGNIIEHKPQLADDLPF